MQRCTPSAAVVPRARMPAIAPRTARCAPQPSVIPRALPARAAHHKNNPSVPAKALTAAAAAAALLLGATAALPPPAARAAELPFTPKSAEPIPREAPPGAGAPRRPLLQFPPDPYPPPRGNLPAPKEPLVPWTEPDDDIGDARAGRGGDGGVSGKDVPRAGPQQKQKQEQKQEQGQGLRKQTQGQQKPTEDGRRAGGGGEKGGAAAKAQQKGGGALKEGAGGSQGDKGDKGGQAGIEERSKALREQVEAMQQRLLKRMGAE